MFLSPKTGQAHKKQHARKQGIPRENIDISLAELIKSRRKKIKKGAEEGEKKMVRDFVDQTLKAVEENLREDIPPEDKEQVLGMIEFLGYELATETSLAVVLSIAVGAMQHDDDEEFRLDDEQQMKELEAEGTQAIFKEFPMGLFITLLQKQIDRTWGSGDEDKEEDNEEENKPTPEPEKGEDA